MVVVVVGGRGRGRRRRRNSLSKMLTNFPDKVFGLH